MATRTVKMYGKAYGENVSLNASFNNVQIKNGAIPAVNSPADISVAWNNLDVIVEFSLDSSVSGAIPFTATVSGGTFVFHTFHANYCGDVIADDGTTVETPSSENWMDISYAAVSPDSGHNNIVIAGESRTRDLESFPELTGPWNWSIDDGETMSMDVEVSLPDQDPGAGLPPQ